MEKLMLAEVRKIRTEIGHHSPPGALKPEVDFNPGAVRKYPLLGILRSGFV